VAARKAPKKPAPKSGDARRSPAMARTPKSAGQVSRPTLNMTARPIAIFDDPLFIPRIDLIALGLTASSRPKRPFRDAEGDRVDRPLSSQKICIRGRRWSSLCRVPAPSRSLSERRPHDCHP
jgi:hypothetical protein